MIFSPAPTRENYLDDKGKSVIALPWQWKKWFDLLYKVLNEINTEYIRTHTVTTSSTSLSLTDAHGTVVIDTDGQTVTLPAASTARIGMEWTIIFATTGTCTINCAGSDTFPAVTSATETSAVINARGDSLIFKCTSSSTWGLV